MSGKAQTSEAAPSASAATPAPLSTPVFTWINHASFLLELGDVRLVCDPWLSGAVFNRAWRHISPTRFAYGDFANVTHIWFSHQHPDHFYPPDLRRIDPAIRKRIKVMYHRTIDKKVVRFCKGLGFADQMEMDEKRWYQLSDELAVCCGVWFERDSWIAVRTPSGTILNINDCVVDSKRLARDIARAVGPVRVLMNQFSYASWEPDPAARAAAAHEHLERIAMQVRVFKPEFDIPFGSYGYYCNADNFVMNDAMNRVSNVARFIETQPGCSAVVMYPGDRWRLGDPHDWRQAAARYDADFEACVAAGPTDQPQAVPLETLRETTLSLLSRVRHKNPFAWLLRQSSTTVRLTDLRCTVMLSPSGLEVAPPNAQPDIEIASDSLFNCLKAPWGSDALRANGRFTCTTDRGRQRFFRYFKLADWNDHGYVLATRRFIVLLSFALRQSRRRLQRRIDRFTQPLAHSR